MIDRRQLIALALASPFAISSSAFARKTAALQAWTEDALRRFNLPGAVTAVRLPGGRILSAAAGFADVEARLPMRTEHRFLGASMGKTFVSALCMRLQREGTFNLGDKISVWLGGESWFDRLPNGRDITLRNLLNHSSGLRDFIDEPGYADTRAKSLYSDWVLPTDQKIALVLDHPPLFPAGQGYKYSDTNYILLGVIIERVLAQEYYSVVERLFIKPLKLKRTSPSNKRKLDRLAVGYTMPGTRYDRFGLPNRLVENGLLIYNPATEWTGGGYVSNPIDWVHWLHSLFDGSAISRGDLPEMMRPARLQDEALQQFRGAGFKVINTPTGRIVGHWGAMAGYSGFMGHLPDKDLTFAMQANATALDHLAADIGLAETASAILEHSG